MVGDVIDHNGYVGALVVDGGEGVVLLLAGRVPYLESYFVVVYRDGLLGETGPDGGLDVGVEVAPDEAVDETRLAHSRVPQHHHLHLPVFNLHSLFLLYFSLVLLIINC